MGKAGIGYSRFQGSPFYYNAGIDLAYGGKNRLVGGLGFYYNAGYTGSKLLNGNLGYLLFGKKHIFFTTTVGLYYDPNCNCPDFSPFELDLLLALGWKF